MVKINKRQALSLLSKVVRAKGKDYVYPGNVAYGDGSGCRYVKDGKPSCMVGLALSEAGVYVEGIFASRGNGLSIGSVVREVPAFTEAVTLTPGALSAFMAAQDAQDNGHEYGNALRAAKGLDF